jgi:xanthine dehydrogenase accessory factor
MKELQSIVGWLCASDSQSVLATLVTVDGSSYRRPGARMLFPGSGGRIGSISGGCLEEDLAGRSARVASSGRAELAVYDTTSENDVVWGVGLGCHGVVRILLEALPPRPAWALALAENLRAGRPTDLEVTWEDPRGRAGTALRASSGGFRHGVFADHIEAPISLTLFGAGDDAQPLARMALELGWRVTVADPRPSMPTEARFPGAFALVLGPADELVARASPPQGSLAVVMTHHYLHDAPILRHLLPLPLAYLGLLGPRKRSEKILADLEAQGLAVTADMRGRLRAPVGLDIGAEAPEEVALSIIAEMTAVVSGRNARPLRERDRPIHA